MENPFTLYSTEKLITAFDRTEGKLCDLILEDGDDVLIHNYRLLLSSIAEAMDLRGLPHPAVN